LRSQPNRTPHGRTATPPLFHFAIAFRSGARRASVSVEKLSQINAVFAEQLSIELVRDNRLINRLFPDGQSDDANGREQRDGGLHL